MADFEIDERVDITDVVCPMTFVKATKRSYQRWILSDSLQGAVMNKRQTRRKLYGKESQYRRI